MQERVRCPYCVLDEEFRPMVAHVDGTHICSRCGHTTRPGEAAYQCRCLRCVKIARPYTFTNRPPDYRRNA
jgi:hypothetical protein